MSIGLDMLTYGFRNLGDLQLKFSPDPRWAGETAHTCDYGFSLNKYEMSEWINNFCKPALQECKIFAQECFHLLLESSMELFHVVLSVVPEIIHKPSATTEQLLIDF